MARRASCVARSKQSNTCHPWQSQNSDFCEGASNVFGFGIRMAYLMKKGFDSIQNLQDLKRDMGEKELVSPPPFGKEPAIKDPKNWGGKKRLLSL